MCQAIADPTTNLHQPAVTPLPTKHSERDRVVGNKLRPAPLAAAANWECDGPCGNSYSGSHEWQQEKNADGRKLYYCVTCTYDKTGWWHFSAEKPGCGELYKMCVEARKAAEQDFAVQQNGGGNGSSSSDANDMDVD